MRVRFSVLIIVVMMIGSLPSQSALSPNQISAVSVSITGDVVDNFANLTYTSSVSNPGSSDQDVKYEFEIDENLFLSNFSLHTDAEMYWGEVKELQQAQEDYDDAISSNKTAVLVQARGSLYSTQFNLKAGDTAFFAFYFQGYVFRDRGKYDFMIYRPTVHSQLFFDHVEMDIDVISSTEEISKIRFNGFVANSVSKTTSKTLNFSYETQNYDGSPLSVTYFVSNLYAGGKLLAYSNGTHNFFNYFFSPEIYDISHKVSREYVFVIDTSGSMGGDRLLNAKSSFNALLDTLDENDFFNVIEFNSDATSFSTESIIASALNINNAKNWVANLAAGGSTDIDTAMKEAFYSFDNERISSKVVVFLSDGQPTDGVGSDGNWEDIVDNARRANTEEAVIFSVSLGTQTEEELMATLAYRTGGEFLIVQNDSDLEIGLSKFYELFELPVGIELGIYYNTSVSHVYPNQEFLANQVFNGSEIIQTGVFEDDLKITTSLFLYDGVARYENDVTATNQSLEHVERIWAINHITSLQRMLEISDDAELKRQITSIALQYQIVVDGFTAMIAIAEENTKTQETTDDFQDYPAARDTVTAAPINEVVSTVDEFQTVFEELNAFSYFIFMTSILLVPIIRTTRNR